MDTDRERTVNERMKEMPSMYNDQNTCKVWNLGELIKQQQKKTKVFDVGLIWPVNNKKYTLVFTLTMGGGCILFK